MHATDEPLIIRGEPIAGKQGPRHYSKLKIARGGGEPWVSPAEGWAEEFWLGIERGGNGVVASTEFVAGLRARAPEKIRVRIGVIADDVAARYGFAKKFGILAGVLADNEERCTGVVALEEIEKFRRHGGIRPVVKRDGELAR